MPSSDPTEHHLRIVIAAHALVILIVSISRWLDVLSSLAIAAAGGALPVTLIGTTVPDLDHPRPIPHRRFRPCATALSAGITAGVLHANRSDVIALAATAPVTMSPTFLAGELTVTLVMGAAGATYLSVPALLTKPVHRGLFHQLPTGGVAAVVLYGGCVFGFTTAHISLPLLVAGVIAGSFFTGFVAHLAADGLLRCRQTYLGQTLDERW